MNLRVILYIIGALIAAVGLCMLAPLGVSIYFGEGDANSFLYSSLLTVSVGLAFVLLSRSPGEMGTREAFAVVTLGWVSAAFFGSLPFLFYGSFGGFTDAIFESMSGFTTTGATVLTNIEAQPHGILLWRSLIQWLGGMGIIVLSLAILPTLGVGGMQIFKAEVPGPTPDRLSPRIKETARLLWVTYLIFSAAEVVLLYLGDVSLYEAVSHAFTTMATGGFSTKATSIGAYNSAYVDTVITVFMFLAGVNFVLHYSAIRGKPTAYFRDSEFLFYITVLLVATLIITVQTRIDIYGSLSKAFRYSIFQVISMTTTTGYGTADYGQWPFLSRLVLFILIFMGGCAGSTGGAMKQGRMLMFIKQSYYELSRLVHPKAVISMKMSGKPVPSEVIHGAMAFFLVYTGTFLLASLIMASLGYDIITSLGSVAATLGNIGPGFGLVGPTYDYAHIPILGKWVLIVCMLMGRLEIYTVLVLFTATYWRQ